MLAFCPISNFHNGGNGRPLNRSDGSPRRRKQLIGFFYSNKGKYREIGRERSLLLCENEFES